MKRNARLRNSAKLHQVFFFGREPKLHGVSQAAVGLRNEQEFADIYNEKNGVALRKKTKKYVHFTENILLHFCMLQICINKLILS